jgi:hypothetical protein
MVEEAEFCMIENVGGIGGNASVEVLSSSLIDSNVSLK